MFTDSSGFEETFCAMNRTKIQMFVKGWDCPKFFKSKKKIITMQYHFCVVPYGSYGADILLNRVFKC